MGGAQDPEAPAGGGKAAGFSSSSSRHLPPSAPPHLQGQDPHQYQYQYGTFQPPPHAASGEFRHHPPVGFPQPAPPPGFGGDGGHGHHQPQQPYYAQGTRPCQVMAMLLKEDP